MAQHAGDDSTQAPAGREATNAAIPLKDAVSLGSVLLSQSLVLANSREW